MDRKYLILSAVILCLIVILGCDDDPASVSDQRYSVKIDTSFAVSNNWMLAIENFVGNISVRSGVSGIINISATKWAEHEGDLEKIIFESIFKPEGGTIIVTENPSHVEGGEVDFNITIPPDAWVWITNGVGNTSYTGRPLGTSLFETGVGSMSFNLPGDINMAVELSVGVGNIYSDFRVIGQVSQQSVNGVIGTGADGKIVAEVGAGNLRLNKQ